MTDRKTEFPKYKCLRCDYEWLPRVVEVKACPRCKSPSWNKPRGEKPNER